MYVVGFDVVSCLCGFVAVRALFATQTHTHTHAATRDSRIAIYFCRRIQFRACMRVCENVSRRNLFDQPYFNHSLARLQYRTDIRYLAQLSAALQ